MEFEKINERIIWTETGSVNSVAINLGKKVYIIDSLKNWNIAQEWRDIIEDQFNNPVSGLILTHHHGDHIFGNQIFTDVPIISSYGIREKMIESQKDEWTPENLKEWQFEQSGYGVKDLQITLPTLCFDNNLRLFDNNTTLIIKCVNGHTHGSSYLWETKTKTLIAGDLIFNRQFPYGADPSCDPIIWQKIMEELIALNPRLIISGHGPIAQIEDLKEINNFLLSSIEFIKTKLAEGKSTQDIINDPNFPNYYSEDREERKKYTIENWVEFFGKKGKK